MADFQKVPALCGLVEIKIDCTGDSSLVTILYRNTNKKAVKIYGVHAILPQGVPYGIFECDGTPYKKPDEKFDCIPVFMLADREGYYSRRCPSCNKLFRTKSAVVRICPYCASTFLPQSFLTEEQLNYIKDYTKIYIESLNTKQNSIIDLDFIKEKSNASEQEYYFFEEKQQTTFKCDKCGLETNILGIYAYCPVCGKRNTLIIIENQLQQLQNRVDNPRYSTKEKKYRDEEWREITKQCVSYFEVFSRDIVNEITKIVPMLPKRQKLLEKINFHNPIDASELLNECVGINFLDGIDNKEKIFIKKRFLRRHIYEHCGGIADQQYIDKADEKSIKTGQLIRERASNVLTLIDLVRRMALSLDRDFHLLSLVERD